MNVKDLIEALSELDEDTEVRFMAQPSWPFEYSILPDLWMPTPSEVCTACGGWLDMTPDGPKHAESRNDDHEVETDTFEPHGDAEKVVYLVEGTQLAYGSKDAWNRR